MPYNFDLLSAYLASLRLNRFSFTAIAAATIANLAQRQIPPAFPPHLRTNGGTPQATRRFILAHILNSAARLVLPARQHGGNFLNVKLYYFLIGD